MTRNSVARTLAGATLLSACALATGGASNAWGQALTARSEPVPVNATPIGPESTVGHAAATLGSALTTAVEQLRMATQAIERCLAERAEQPTALQRARYAECRIDRVETAKHAKRAIHDALSTFAADLATHDRDMTAVIESITVAIADTERDHRASEQALAQLRDDLRRLKATLADASEVSPEQRAELHRAFNQFSHQSALRDIHGSTLETLRSRASELATYRGYVVTLQADVVGLGDKTRLDIDLLSASQHATAVTSEPERLISSGSVQEVGAIRDSLGRILALDVTPLVTGGRASTPGAVSVPTVGALFDDATLLERLRNFDADATQEDSTR